MSLNGFIEKSPQQDLCAKFLANYVATLQGIQLLLAASHHDSMASQSNEKREVLDVFFGLLRTFPKSLQKVMDVDISQAMNC